MSYFHDINSSPIIRSPLNSRKYFHIKFSVLQLLNDMIVNVRCSTIWFLELHLMNVVILVFIFFNMCTRTIMSMSSAALKTNIILDQGHSYDFGFPPLPIKHISLTMSFFIESTMKLFVLVTFPNDQIYPYHFLIQTFTFNLSNNKL